MSTIYQSWELQAPIPTLTPDGAHWYAVHTRARHEKVVAGRLREQGIATFLPLINQVHRWSDRTKSVEVPLFSCYVFVRILPTNEDRLRVCKVDGVFQVLGNRGEAMAIPDEQIEAVRTVVGQAAPWSPHPFLKVGQRVRVRGGAMDGVEGALLAVNGDRTLVVSVDVIQRSIAVRIEGYEVEPV